MLARSLLAANRVGVLGDLENRPRRRRRSTKMAGYALTEVNRIITDLDQPV